MCKKDELRKSAKTIRKSLDMKDISNSILQIFQSLECYKVAQHIAIYYPYASELDLRPLLDDADKAFYLPKSLASGDLSFHFYSKTTELEKDNCGILAPKTQPIDISLLDLIIIPALMADKAGYRLGYGKAFYDKFLTKTELKAQKIIFVPNELYVDALPVEKWDIPVDMIITQSGIVFSAFL